MESRRLHLILRQLRVTNAFIQESERIDLLFQRNNIDDNTMDKRKTRGHIDLTKEDEHLLILVLTLSRKVEKKTKSSCNSVLT